MVSHTTGPGVVLPNALVFKLFGFGFWQSRLGSLFFFLLFLTLVSAILYFIQGLIGVIVFNLYLFFFPQLYVFLGYEAMGEVPGMVYLLLSFILFIKGIQVEKRAWLWFFASGILIGFAANSRLPTLINLAGFAVVWFILYRQKRITFKAGLTVAAGLLLVAAVWQLVVLISLMRVSDFASFVNHVLGRFEFFFRSVRGITPIAEGMELFLLKAIILSEISYSHLLVSLLLGLTTAVGGLLLIRYLWAETARRDMTILIYSAWVVYTIWFLNGPKNAWVRYYWFGLIWMIMLLALMFAVLVRQVRWQPGPANIAGATFLTGLFIFSFSSQPQALHMFITPDLIDRWHQRQLTTRDTYLPWIIITRQEQEQVVDFIQSLPPDTMIYYPEGHKTAEISFLTNRIFYTLPRRRLQQAHPNDMMIIGPAVISPWKKEQQQRLGYFRNNLPGMP